MALIVILVSIVLTHLTYITCEASTHYQAYETVSELVRGDSKLKAEKIYIAMDSEDDVTEPTIKLNKKTVNGMIDPDRSTSKDTISSWSGTKRAGTKLRRPVKNSWFHEHNIIGNPDYDTGSMNSITGHQSFARMRPRTVESPALSVDTGLARSTNPSVRLANRIKKLFNVEEGHYTDIYERIDKHKPLNKKKPAEKIDERLGLVPRH